MAGGQTDGTATRKWFATSVDDHSTLQAELAVMSSAGGSNHTGRLEGRRMAGWSKISPCSGRLSLEWTLSTELFCRGLQSSEMRRGDVA